MYKLLESEKEIPREIEEERVNREIIEKSRLVLSITISYPFSPLSRPGALSSW
jgi:hypothetical protein